ncbi:MAG: S-layer homology domain-containing protein [Oscillospiraceae bacterium]|nr:S-layer homology domain-containing protein [Oscillospiraceae bacterium]
MFGYIKSATIKNVTTAGTVGTGIGGTGALVQYIDNRGPADAAVPAVIENCVNYANVSGTGTNGTGGLIGRIYTSVNPGPVYITDCVNYGTISLSGSTPTNAGGIAGIAWYGVITFSGCVNNGNVSSTINPSNYLGGISGNVNSGAKVVFEYCGNNGNISCTTLNGNGNGGVGGITGDMWGYALLFKGCYNTGTITQGPQGNGTKYYYIGGIAPSGRVVEDCYNTGAIVVAGTGNNVAAGGLIGAPFSQGTPKTLSITNSYSAMDGFTGTPTATTSYHPLAARWGISGSEEPTFDNAYYLLTAGVAITMPAIDTSAYEVADKDALIAAVLGITDTPFAPDITPNINNGYPILKSQLPAPTITIDTDPANVTVTEGEITESLTVAASSDLGFELTYQWYDEDGAISGATDATLAIPTGLAVGTYDYYVEVSSTTGFKSSTETSATATVTVEEKVTIPEAKPWVNPFTDVSEDDWFYSAVEFASKNKLVSGTSDTTFSPNVELTRGMLVTILHSLEGKPAATAEKFTDVAEDAYYAKAVDWARANKIVAGVTDTEFAPNASITREQLATILYSYAKYKGYDIAAAVSFAAYGDAGEVSDYAKTAISWAVAQGFIKGRSETAIEPQGTATRAEVVTMLKRLIEKYSA